ncbi:MAG: FHA domain-containing protein [Actinomycetota bacterium]
MKFVSTNKVDYPHDSYLKSPLGDHVPLNITYQETETTVDDGATALVGADAASTVRIVRPGISRKHAIASFDGTAWKIEDAGSRNGVFLDGQRIQTTVLDGPKTLYLGHPTDGEAVSFVPLTEDGDVQNADIQDEINAFVLPDSPKESKPKQTKAPEPQPTDPTRVQQATGGASSAELAELTAALRDQINAVKGLTWSVWAMIAVTAVLAIMTLFVGILGS